MGSAFSQAQQVAAHAGRYLPTPRSFDEIRGLAPCLVSAGKGSDTGAMRTDEGIELSLPREALQFVKATVRELEPRPVD